MSESTGPRQGDYWTRRRDGIEVRVLESIGPRERGGYAIGGYVVYRKTVPEAGRRDAKLAQMDVGRFQKLFQKTERRAN